MRTFYEFILNEVTSEKNFEDSLKKNPHDSLALGAYHDWLEESGQTAKAEIVRAVYQLAQNPAKQQEIVEGLWKLTRANKGMSSRGNELLHELEQIRPLYWFLRGNRNVAQMLLYHGHEINEEWLMANLPSGSGIDGRWDIDEQGNNFICNNYYHAMNEHGSYAGYVHFQVTVPINDPLEFEVEVNQDDVNRLEERGVYLGDLDEMLHSDVRNSFTYVLSRQHKMVP